MLLIFTCLLTANSAIVNAAEEPDGKLTGKEIAQLKQAFLADDAFLGKFKRLNELEQQALQLAEDEPLKLGSLGSAILDIYPASHTGHYVLQQFYAYLDTDDAYLRHSTTLQSLQQHMQKHGDGSSDAPFPVMTIHDAHTFAIMQQTSLVGSIYQTNRDLPLAYLMVTRPQQGSLLETVFDLEHLLSGFSHGSQASANDEQADEGIVSAPPPPGADVAYANHPWMLIRLFAADSDSAAQSAIGAYLAAMKKYDQAVGWLRAASRDSNVLANRLLARIYFAKADQADNPEKEAEFKDLALENYMHAIALGSGDAMYTLANLYINNYYGEENNAAGLPLLQQAAELDHTESLIYLGHLYDSGDTVAQDKQQAEDYFARAAAKAEPQAILNYGRFLTARQAQASASILTALQDLAKQGNAEAMVVLGNLHARGIGTKASIRTALRWYKRAVRKAPEDADIVNEVAWTLTVSDVEGLPRSRYAKRIMDKLMNQQAASRERPEYLDTWAATHAANGDFDQAIILQQQALAAATAQQRSDVMEILEEHLEQFKNGITITEPAP